MVNCIVMTSYSCGSTISVSTPELCMRGLKIGKQLGKGDIGAAYEMDGLQMEANIQLALDPQGAYVLKKIQFPSSPVKLKKAMKDFSYETSIGHTLGEAGLAPRIYGCWTCNASPAGKSGYIVMDKLIPWTSVYGDATHYKQPPIQVEKDVVRKVLATVKLGFLHQDCHLGNIGFSMQNKVILFDFGFTVSYGPCAMCMPYQVYLLISQLAIIVEQMPFKVKQQSYIYGFILYAYQHLTDTLADLDAYIDQGSDEMIMALARQAQPLLRPPMDEASQSMVFNTLYGTSKNLFAAQPCECNYVKEAVMSALLYRSLLQYADLEDLFNENNHLYDLIYVIRRNEITFEQMPEYVHKTYGFMSIPASKKRAALSSSHSHSKRTTRSQRQRVVGGTRTRRRRKVSHRKRA